MLSPGFLEASSAYISPFSNYIYFTNKVCYNWLSGAGLECSMS